MNYAPLTSIPKHAEYLSFWQSPIWASILVDSGQAKEVFYFGNSTTFVQVEIRSVGTKVAAFCLGVHRNQIAPIEEREFLDSLRVYLRKKHCLFLHFESIEESIYTPTKYQYRNFLVPYTRLLSLLQDENEIFSQMHEKCRYNIRLAEKRGVKVRSVLPTGENMTIWMNLLEVTTKRDHFATNSRQYFETFLHKVIDSNLGELLFAYYGDKVIAAIITVYTSSRGIYYYGASSSLSEERKHMAPYLLQWHAIQETIKRGIKIYDFLGVGNPHNPKDPLTGVTQFKEKFGGITLLDVYPVTFPLSFQGRTFLLLRRLLGRFR